MQSLDRKLIIDLLNDRLLSIDVCDSIENRFQANRIIEQISLLENGKNAHDMRQIEGGQRLGHVRGWMQRKAINGESVTWGSNDFLNLKSLSVADFESLAAVIAANAINEFLGK